jgi:protein tyrosine phosphatase (PTP) superfamily phosphohydrolase (DUF442 family)
MRAAAVSLVFLALCGAVQPPSPLALPTLTAEKPVEYPGLLNVVAYAPNIYSGSAPEGATGFESLRLLGFKTILSVDGAAPDVAAAKAVGLRYIHLPIGYNGMDRRRTLEIAQAIKLAAAKGPVYIHCHHGMHRAAGATGAAMVTLGLLNADDATKKLHEAGTSPSYPGLYRCVAVAQLAAGADLDAVGESFPEISGPTGLVQAMVDVDGAFDHLKAIEAAGWTVPKDQPDLVPAAEAGRLSDLLRVSSELERAKAQPEDFRSRLAAASKDASEIEQHLVRSGEAPDARAMSAKLKSLGQSCKDCHAKYRDDPGIIEKAQPNR